jgi:hypothetical protein
MYCNIIIDYISLLCFRFTMAGKKDKKQSLSASQPALRNVVEDFISPPAFKRQQLSAENQQSSKSASQPSTSHDLNETLPTNAEGAPVSEQELEELSNSVAFYVVCVSANKHPITRSELMKAVFANYNHKCYAPALKMAAETLDVVFGIRLVPLDDKPIQKSDKLILINGMATPKKWVELNESNEDQKSHEVLLVLILNVIYMSGGTITEDQLNEFLMELKIKPGDTADPAFGNIPARINALKSQLYLKYELNNKATPPVNVISWGPRAHAEASKKAMLSFCQQVLYSIIFKV